MQNAGAIAGAAHAGIRYAQHVFDTLFDQLERNRQHAPLRHTGAALWAGIAQHHDVVSRHVKVLVVNGCFHGGVVVKHQRRAGVLQVLLGAGAGLDHAAVGRQVAAQNGQRTFGINRVVQRANHVMVVDLGAHQIFTHGLAAHGQGVQLEVVFEHAHHGQHAAGVIKIFHQVGVAAWANVGNHRHPAACRIKVVQANGAVLSGAARHGHQMNDGVGRAAHGHGHGDGVFKRRARQHFGGRQVFPNHFNGAAPALSGHADVARVNRRNRRGTRQRQANGLGNAGHGAGRAHGHAVAVAAGNAAFNFKPLGCVDLAGTPLVPKFPGVRARAQHFAFDVAAQHRPGGHEHKRHPGTQSAQHQSRRGLVATAHQHRAVNRVAAQQFLGVHGQHVPIQHGRGLDERFRQRQRRQFKRKAARLQHAALDVFHALLEVPVAGANVAPGIKNGDDWLAFPVFRAIAQLHHA